LNRIVVSNYLRPHISMDTDQGIRFGLHGESSSDKLQIVE
jgi:hypothetical protein